MIIDRKELLSKLLMAQIGISSKEILQQSSCVILKRGRFYSLSEEISCSISSGLPEEWEAAVRCEELVKWLDKSPEEEVELSLESKVLKIRGEAQKRWVKFACESDIILPVDSVEKPKLPTWKKIPVEFGLAIDRCCMATAQDDAFLYECLHICPDRIEASDNRQMIRWMIDSPAKGPVLVRGRTAKKVAQLGMNKAAETENWLHFANSAGLRASLRKFKVEKYPDLGVFLDLRGDVITFPRVIEEVVERASFLADKKGLKITLSKDRVIVEAEKEAGHSWESSDVQYQGRNRAFLMAPKAFLAMLSQTLTCEVTDCSLRAEVDTCVHCLSLEKERT